MAENELLSQYNRIARYHDRSMKKSAETLKALISKPPSSKIVSEVKTMIAEISKEFEKFKTISEQAFESVDQTLDADKIKKNEDAIQNNLELAKRLVLPIISEGNTYISDFEGERVRESLSNNSLNQSIIGSSEPNVKLPRINLPTFDGNYEEFLEFSALFQNVVHEEPTISKVKKLYYLKSALTGDALSLVKDIPLTDRGYEEAWGLVVSTYRDMKKIIRKHFDNLFSITPIKSSDDIPSLLANVNRILKGLKACGEEPDNWSSILCYMVSERIDEQTYLDFEKSLTTNTKFPTWKALRTFLESRSSVTKRRTDTQKPNPKPKAESVKRSAVLTATNTDNHNAKPESKPTNPIKPKCVCCMKFHLLIECDDFKAKNPKQRFELLKSKSTCINCFKSNHKTAECNRSASCKKCSGRHHTMLHFDNAELAKESTKPSSNESNADNVSSHSASCMSVKSIARDNKSVSLSVRNQIALLPTAIVNFESNGKCGKMRVLLDSGSQTNLITRNFVNRFKIKSVKSNNHAIVGVTNTKAICNRVVNLVIKSCINNFAFKTDFNILDSDIPYSVCSLFTGTLTNEIRNLPLADPEYLNDVVNIEIDAVLGIEAYDLCVQGEVRRMGSLSLRNTLLGWTISSSSSNQATKTVPYCGVTVTDIDNRLKRFWEIEDVHRVPDTNLTEAEECDKHFERTYTRSETGQFVVRLPFKDDPAKIVNNYNRALWCLNQTQRRLTEPISQMYTDFMTEYAALGHMSVVNNNVPRYFIPHHAVLRPSSTTTKLRVVFNASSKSPPHNLSLNDILMIGPNLQPDIFENLIRFRTYRHAYTSDAEKMYRRIIVDERDRPYQSILWNGQINELNTVTYGTGPASYQAQKCLQKLADEAESTDPVAAQYIRENFYMDDFAGGADTESEIIRLQKSVHQILLSGGFLLRKYQSNSTKLLNEIDAKLIETNLTVTFGSNESLSVLGLSWTPSTDTFNLKSDIESPARVTKRVMLSIISKTFDPLGFASPVIVRGKMLFQSLWKRDLKWDDVVPDDIATEFKSYVNDLNEISKLSIPRYLVNFNRESARLIGFCDASERAYCAAIYIADYQSSTVNLLCAKTRVAPIKLLKIPQLELQAAVLLSELADRVRKLLKIDTNRVALFSDSTIVLSWLARPPADWKTFVRNRVSKIINAYPANQWNHVRSNDNPADLATRGLSITSLLRSNLWLSGPEFVQTEINQRVENEINPDSLQYLSKPKSAVCFATETKSLLTIIASYSSYTKLLRVFATVRAVFSKWHTKSKNPVQVDKTDLEFSFLWLIRIVQETEFADELQRMRSNQKLRRRSRLRSLTPFIHTDSVLRSKSRLQNARLPFNQKSPVILPANHHFTILYVRHLHERYFHANRPFMLSYLSGDFIFVGGMSRLIKSIIRDCVTCRRHFYKPVPQQIANLPSDRVTPQSPFNVVGIDFTGAFTTKCNYHRTIKYNKSYACIFVCFVTRAVHIELVPSLSTEDFLNALKCFIARRGLPSTIFSDNGTNFRGADRYLSLTDPNITKHAEENLIRWNFNPPYTPHRGGIWESAVKSAKRFIPIVTKGQTFTENELRTLLTQIEAILNSRPLAYSKTNEPDEEILTPSHFLIGRNLSVVPEPSTHQTTISLSERYRANRQRVRDFWRLWSQDYLNQLKSRSKWIDPQPNLVEGQVVVLKDQQSNPCDWKLAKIIKCLPDTSNLVRTVIVKTDSTEKKLPVNHVIPLPISKPTMSTCKT